MEEVNDMVVFDLSFEVSGWEGCLLAVLIIGCTSEKGILTYVIDEDPISHFIRWDLSSGPRSSNFQTTQALI